MVRWLKGVLLAAALAGAPPGAAAATNLADFAGIWRGVEITEVDGGAPFDLTADDLDMTIAPDRDGFRITWEAPDSGRLEAAFAPTDRPGVFDVRPGGHPLLGLFFSPATGNPLEGQTLLWSRLEGATLIVYRLKLERDGRFNLHRYAWTLADGQTMTVSFSRLSDGPTEVTFAGRVERVGG